MKKYKMSKRMIIGLGIVCSALFLGWQNNGLMVNEMSYIHKGLPEAFDGYRVLQVSDLHNKTFGKQQRQLVEATRKAAPDVIVITGDVIDCHRTDVEAAMTYIEQVVTLAPVYYVSGNHEAWAGLEKVLAEKLESIGVHVLYDEKTLLEIDGDVIEIVGLQDKMIPDTAQQLERLMDGEEDVFTLLLAHRPEYVETYSQYLVELVLSGHAHGGQIRLPFIGGMYAPGQGIGPKYTSGRYDIEKTTMVVSRGLGNSVFPFRVFNRPELVVITLQKG
ncbi:MAG: metallophosphoesterase [Cellulosilyticaceae bacterium]